MFNLSMSSYLKKICLTLVCAEFLQNEKSYDSYLNKKVLDNFY